MIPPGLVCCIQAQGNAGTAQEEFYDYVLAHGPEFVRGRQEADDAIARGELGIPLADVLADLDAEDLGDRRSA